MKTIVVIILVVIGFQSFSQNAKPIKKTVQLSGILVTEDSLKPVKGASIKVTKTDSIDYSYFFSVPTDENGFFILMARPGDIIGFKKEGYFDTNYTVPDTLKAAKYSITQQIKSNPNIKTSTKKKSKK